jgi:hypothetical protein
MKPAVAVQEKIRFEISQTVDALQDLPGNLTGLKCSSSTGQP